MSKVKMTFEPDMAKIVGTDAAIIYSNIDFWVDTNKANNRNFHDGKYWTYNSIKAFIEQFTWLTESQIKTCLSKLEKHELILSGNYNASPYDRTKWYTVSENTISYLSQMDKSVMPNTLDDNSQPIPYNKPNINQIEETPLLFSETDLPTETLKTSSKNKKEAAAAIFFAECKWSDYVTLRDYLAKDKEFVEKFKGVDLKHYIRKADMWSENNPQKRRTERGWLLSIRDWITEANNTRTMVKLPEKPNTAPINDGKFYNQ